ncbi:MAG: hypothetical protein K8R38_00385 [Verrucomicrobia bacterium]|nr:hypothetical protein [Verrucomicrobiota bacterium]
MNQTPREVLDTILGHLGFLVEIEEQAPRIIVDVENHRSMRDDSFLHRIHQLADAVRSNGRPVETEPLNSYDRRLVHNAYREDAELETASPEGVDKIKRVTIRRRG